MYILVSVNSSKMLVFFQNMLNSLLARVHMIQPQQKPVNQGLEARNIAEYVTPLYKAEIGVNGEYMSK